MKPDPLLRYLIQKGFLSEENLKQSMAEFQHLVKESQETTEEIKEESLFQEINYFSQETQKNTTQKKTTYSKTIVEETRKITPQSVDSTVDFSNDKDDELRYQIIETLGQGGMGIVQLVRDNLLGREVALKKIKFSKGMTALSNAQRAMLWRLSREASITAILEHPNIVPLYDMQQKSNGELFFTMRKIEGTNLKKMLYDIRTQKKMLATSKLISIFLKICDAVSYAHNQGVIHRDLKPENIMVGEFGEVYVVDWGIAKKTEMLEDEEISPFEVETKPIDSEIAISSEKTEIYQENATKTSEEEVSTFIDQVSEFEETEIAQKQQYHTVGGLGTVGYMAPEQYEDAASVTSRADIFSLGKILQECYTYLSPMESFHKIVADSYPKRKASISMNKNQPKIPKDIQAIITKAVQENPLVRYQSVYELSKDLRNYLENKEVSARRYTVFALWLKWSERNWKKLFVIFTLLLLCVLTGASVTLFQKKKIEASEAEARKSAQEATLERNIAKQERDKSNAITLAFRANKLIEKNQKKRTAFHLVKRAYQLNPKNREVIQSCYRVMVPPTNFFQKFEHNGMVNAAYFSPDETKILTCSNDKTAKLWTPKGKLLVTLGPFKNPISQAIFSPTGSKILLMTKNEANLYDLKGLLLAKLLHKDYVKKIQFSKDEEFILTSSRDGTVKLWDKIGKELKEYPHLSYSLAASFSPNCNKIFTVFQDKILKIWDLQGNLITKLPHQRSLKQAIFSPNGHWVLTLAGSKKIKLWNMKGELLSELIQHDKQVNCLKFSPDSQKILTTSDDGTAKVWTLDGKILKDFQDHKFRVADATFSTDGTKILSCSNDTTARLWDLHKKEALVLPHKSWVKSGIFSPDNKTILTITNSKSVYLWDCLGNLLATYTHHSMVKTASFSNSGKKVLTSSNDGTARLWDFHGILTQTVIQQEGQINNLKFSKDEKFVLIGSTNYCLYLWDIQGNLIQKFSGHRGNIRSVAFSPDESMILSCSNDYSAKVWKRNGDLLLNFVGVQTPVVAGIFTPDGKSFLINTHQGKTKLIDLKGKILQEWSLEKPHDLMVFSQDSSRLLIGSSWVGTHAKLIHLKEKKIIKFEHLERVTSLVFSKNETKILTSSRDKTVKLWDLQGELLVQMDHFHEVNFACFSKDEKKILAGTDDGTIYLWDINGKLLQKIEAHSSKINHLSFSIDNTQIISCSQDKTVKKWDLEGHLIVKIPHFNPVLKAYPFKNGSTFLTWPVGFQFKIWDLDLPLLLKKYDWIEPLTHQEKIEFDFK